MFYDHNIPSTVIIVLKYIICGREEQEMSGMDLKNRLLGRITVLNAEGEDFSSIGDF